MSSMDPLTPEPTMHLHAQEHVDVRTVRWPQDRLTSNDSTTKKLYDKDQVALWRGLGARLARYIRPVPEGAVARVVVHYRQPKGRGMVKDPSNLHPITKALVDGITHGPAGTPQWEGPWPDDSVRYVIGQDDRFLTPPGPLEVIVQVWTSEPRTH